MFRPLVWSYSYGGRVLTIHRVAGLGLLIPLPMLEATTSQNTVQDDVTQFASWTVF